MRQFLAFTKKRVERTASDGEILGSGNFVFIVWGICSGNGKNDAVAL